MSTISVGKVHQNLKNLLWIFDGTQKLKISDETRRFV